MPEADVQAIGARIDSLLAQVATADAQRPSDRNGTRDAVLTAGIRLFARKGFEACTMKDLASAANVKPPALYNHWESKEQVLDEAMLAATVQWVPYMVKPLRAVTPQEWLWRLVTRHTLFEIEQPDIAASTDLLARRDEETEDPESDVTESVRAMRRDYFELMRALIAAATGDPPAAQALLWTHAVVSICDGTGGWYRPSRSLTKQKVVDETWLTVRRLLGVDGRT